MTEAGPTPVEVLHQDGVWYPGILHRWERDRERGWRAFVDYTRAPGLTHRTWVPADRVRRATQETAPPHAEA